MARDAALDLPAAHGFSGDASAARATPSRRVGLALGGGSARGWAHVGIIRELLANDIAIEAIAGTSIGAVVGACHAAGRLDALEAFARGLNRRRVFALLDLSLGGSGLVAGHRLKRRLEREIGGLTFADLAIPFAAIATELGSGREIGLREGDLVQAIRASYALPGIFGPVLIDGCRLFDGAMSNPVPVSICRALGAGRVIGVSLTADPQDDPAIPDAAEDPSLAGLDAVASAIATDATNPGSIGRVQRARRALFARRRLSGRRADGSPGIASVVVGAFSIAQERISRSRLAIDPPDVLIHARLPSVGLFDFHRADELIEHGRLVARAALPRIEASLAAGARDMV